MKRFTLSLIALSALAVAGCGRTTREIVYTPAAPAVTQPAVVVVDTPPPAPRAETPPPAPADSVWVPGYWGWSNGRYDWIAGHYETARSGYTWVPHHWELVNGRWQLTGGGWVRQ
jgi:YXWGXW repeat-containing protein